LPNVSRNFGLDGLTGQDERYASADEYVDVTYERWEVHVRKTLSAMTPHGAPRRTAGNDSANTRLPIKAIVNIGLT
jgi:alkanesulfonate monooxygenase SsuD/methylene tetrahydromethanopterin reductase-like flavin-dependent oxidoreductase (luciferase family)